MKKIVDSVFALFSSLKLTIALLIIILIYLTISTFIPQEISYIKYISENKPLLFHLLNITGLINPYHSFFLSLWLFFFTFNLIACTINRIPAILERLKRNLKKDYIPLETLKKWEDKLPDFDEASLNRLKDRKIRFIETKSDGIRFLIFKKGIYSPLNFLIVHISILIIIAGVFLSATYGYEGSIRLVENKEESFYFREVVRGGYIKMPLPFRLRLNSFKNITLKSGQSVDFISDITIIENDNRVNKIIRVNEPLKYRGILFVQSSYEPNIEEVSFRIRITDSENRFTEIRELHLGEETDLMGEKLKLLDYYEDVHQMGEALKFRYKDRVLIALKNRPDIQSDEAGIHIYIEEIKIPYNSILRITYDPGTKIVFAGSFIFLLSLILVLFYRFKMVVIKRGDKVEIYYSAKNAESYTSYIVNLINEIKEER